MTKFRSDAEATEIYTTAVEQIAARYDAAGGGFLALFTLPQWEQAERAIEVALKQRDTEQFLAAVARLESVAAELLTLRLNNCEHASDPELAAWQRENPQVFCARCWVDRAQ
jgi:hypothetical protein